LIPDISSVVFARTASASACCTIGPSSGAGVEFEASHWRVVLLWSTMAAIDRNLVTRAVSKGVEAIKFSGQNRRDERAVSKGVKAISFSGQNRRDEGGE